MVRFDSPPEHTDFNWVMISETSNDLDEYHEGTVEFYESEGYILIERERGEDWEVDDMEYSYIKYLFENEDNDLVTYYIDFDIGGGKVLSINYFPPVTSLMKHMNIMINF